MVAPKIKTLQSKRPANGAIGVRRGRMRIPEQIDHRSNPISDSGGKPITFGVGTGMVQGI